MCETAIRSVNRNIKRSRWLPLLLTLGVLYAIMIWTTFAGMRRCGGRLVYALDDAYIHLSVARNLVTTHVWGVNPGEFAGASSSLIWPLLLAVGFKIFGVAIWLPLMFNYLAAAGAIAGCWRTLERFLPDPWAAVLALVAVLIAGLPMLVAMGMEHSLQIAVTFCFVLAWLDLLSSGRSKRSISLLKLAVWAILLVAVRFEGLFIVAAACLILLLRRDWVAAAVAAACAWLPVAIYAAFSLRHGGEWLPNSVLIKGNVLPHSLSGFIAFVTRGVSTVAVSAPVAAIVVANLLFLWRGRRGRNTASQAARFLGLLFLGATFLQGQFAVIGWFNRYEAHLVVLGVAAACAMFTSLDTGATALSNLALRPMVWLLAFLATAPLGRAFISLYRTIYAPSNIYEQQLQMGRMVRVMGCRAVAANDIGALSWFGDAYVVDLWGLSNYEVFDARRANRYTPAEIARICAEHRASLAIVYDRWFEAFGGMPGSWRKLATWTIPHNVAAGDATISIYATDPADYPSAREVNSFSGHELPNGVQVNLHPR
jgi:hypothetical protein